MRENASLERIFGATAELPRLFPRVIVGPGDDCAVAALGDAPGSPRMLAKVDQLVEGRHYTPGTPIAAVARKALARPISDIAAMAGRPVWSLASGTLGADWSQARADALFDALHSAAREMDCPLVGGDIATAPAGTPAVLSITVIGVEHDRRGPVLRSTARRGDALYVTGAIGDSLRSGRHLTFSPRLTEARWLADTLGTSLRAMIDISDGLGIDAARLAEASGVRARIDLARVPLHDGAMIGAGGVPRPALAPLADGEDHELLFAVAPGAFVPARCPLTGAALTRIGMLMEGSGAVIIDPSGREHDARAMGYEHGRSGAEQ